MLNGAALSLIWIAPFVGVLLSIAVFPLAAPKFWHHHYGKVSAFWSLAFLLPLAPFFVADLMLHEAAHTVQAEYVPFMILLLSLFTVSGGIHIKGNPHGSPAL